VSQNPVKPGDIEKIQARPAANQGRRTIEECPLWVSSGHPPHVRFTPNNGRWAAHPSQHLAVGFGRGFFCKNTPF
jgi:hypothetical protein